MILSLDKVHDDAPYTLPPAPLRSRRYRWRRRVFLLAFACFLAWNFYLLFKGEHAAQRFSTRRHSATFTTGEDAVRYIDPLIGTSNHGHVFPGASLPYGLAKPVADTSSGENAAGFVSDNSPIIGFSHTHDSGTGGSSSLGNFPLFVHPGCPDDMVSKCAYERQKRAVKRVPGSVEARAGYFAINLTNGVRAEMTATAHTALYRFSFLGSDNKTVGPNKVPYSPVVLVDVQDLMFRRNGGKVNVSADQARMTGQGTFSPSFGEGSYTAYFCADVHGAKVRRAGTFQAMMASEEPTSLDSESKDELKKMAYGGSAGAWMQLERPQQNDAIYARVAVSFKSVEQACHTAEAEVADWDLGKVEADARAAWAGKMSAVQVDPEGMGDDLLRTFWSGLYRTMLSPQNWTGENPLWHSDEPYFDSMYCIWDSFRAQNPLLTLVDPPAQTDIVRAMIDIYKHEGKLPDCRMSLCQGFTQGGSNADVVLADAFIKRLSDDIDWDTAYKAVVSDAEEEPTNWGVHGRGNLVAWHELGYIPMDDSDHNGTGPRSRSVSRGLEYAYDDYCIGLMARGLGHTADADKYHARSGNWRNYWNATQADSFIIDDGHTLDVVQSAFSGFMQPRRHDGSFGRQSTRTCSPLQEPDQCYYSTALHTYEGSPWLYSFYVPQDMAALITFTGGRAAFASRLHYFHTSGLADIGDEQGFLPVFQFHYAGRPALSGHWARRYILERFNATIDGLPGNDDSAMGAFAAFVMMGFFPVAGQDVYLLTPPFFREVRVRAALSTPEVPLWAVVRVKNFDAGYMKERYVETATLDDKPYTKNWIGHDFFRSGGVLEYTLAETEGKWGTADVDLPPSDPYVKPVHSLL